MRAHHPIFDRLIEKCRNLDPVATAIVYPLSAVSLSAAMEAARSGLMNPYLVGPHSRVTSLAREHGIDVAGCSIVDVADEHEAAQRGVELCRVGTCQALVKGSLSTDDFLEPMMADDTGLRLHRRRISHAFVVDAPSFSRTLIITDAAINIYPKLDEKVDIVQNAIDLAHAVGIATPRVAILSAVATVSAKITSTIDAAALCKMADRGQMKGGILDGPLAFDDATQPEAARSKQIHSEVAGHADILVVPDMESGNILANQLQSLDGAEAVGVILGTQVPAILTNAADSAKTRLASAAVAMLLAHQDHQEPVTSGFGVLLQSMALPARLG